MKCKYCGKESTSEICDDCVAKLAHRNAENAENAGNDSGTSPEAAKPAMSPYFAANYGKKGSIISFVCGLLGFILAYVAVFFAALYRQGVIELDKATNSAAKSTIESLINYRKLRNDSLAYRLRGFGYSCLDLRHYIHNQICKDVQKRRKTRQNARVRHYRLRVCRHYVFGVHDGARLLQRNHSAACRLIG